MVHITAATTTGRFGLNLLQCSHPPWPHSGGKLRRSRGLGDRGRRGRKDTDTVMMSSESRTSCRKSGLMCTGRASRLRQELREKATSLHGALWNKQMTKSVFQKGLDLPVSTKPANLNSWSQFRHHPSSHCTTSVCRFPRGNLFANFYFCQINLFPEA